MRPFHRFLFTILFLVPSGARGGDSLTIAVMDPLARELACDCVKGYAQRNYHELGAYLQRRFGIPVQIVFGEDLTALNEPSGPAPALIIGKSSVVRSEAAKQGLAVSPCARLTGLDGSTSQCGLVVVPKDSPARSVADLKGYRILFGLDNAEEKSRAALDLLEREAVPVPDKPETSPTCSAAVAALLALPPGVNAAAVISSYAQPLLSGCGTIRPGDLRVLGRTRDVPFITAFSTSAVSKERAAALREALLDTAKEPALLQALESLLGFTELDTPGTAWNQFRGPHRDGTAARLPDTLPAQATFAWVADLPSEGVGGIAATAEFVVLGSRDGLDSKDFFFAWMP